MTVSPRARDDRMSPAVLVTNRHHVAGAHDLDHLHVAGTSLLPGLGAAEPSLTALAGAPRTGDHLAERLQ
ncbi:hypothetical protein [Streptomyces sp. NPDC001388]|uniref:hypothetical protein n=1 Tax=Streptomyces sp. NPDC001388 TaxID=3364568 RepID=UPI00367C860F